ncbi:hypothetical protein PMAC_001696 [Pneumocystis sp. 'macacae']|nr:hypothetical protein PMAC_001696 [Pneumocystis sp. 'macacae']
MWSSLKQQLSAALRSYNDQENRTHGFHVLWVEDGSVAEKAGIESYYDFICEVDGIELNEDIEWLRTYFTCTSRLLQIAVWSLKDQDIRYVSLMSCKRFGLSLRWCAINTIQKVVWHVLSIANGSPAEIAGLQAYDDYIVGTPDYRLHRESELELLIEKFMNTSLEFYVYNCRYQTTRLVTLIPNRKWGGSGALGCGLGYGYLHQLPRISRERSRYIPVENDVYSCPDKCNERGIPLTETEKMLGEMTFISTSTPQSKTKVRRQRRSSRICDEAVLTLMKEGEAKSEQIARNEHNLYNDQMLSQIEQSFKVAHLEQFGIPNSGEEDTISPVLQGSIVE